VERIIPDGRVGARLDEIEEFLVPFDERFSISDRELVKSDAKRIITILWYLHAVPGFESHKNRNKGQQFCSSCCGSGVSKHFAIWFNEPGSRIRLVNKLLLSAQSIKPTQMGY
jgi:hypothetical protein